MVDINEEETQSSDLNFSEFKYYSDDEIRSLIQQKYSKKFDLILLFSGLFAIVLPLYNIFIIYNNFFVFYESFSDLLKVFVTYFEFVMINIFLFYDVIQMWYHYNDSPGKKLFLFDQSVSNLQFNLFGLVNLLSLNGIFSLFSNARHRGELEVEYLIKKKERILSVSSLIYNTLKCLITVLFVIIYSGVLILIAFSVLTKLSLLSFIGLIPISQWSFNQWLLFLGILNNLSSLSQGDAATLYFMWTVINDEWDKDTGKWKKAKMYSMRMCHLYQIMYQQSRWKTVLWIKTITGRELHDLVRKP